MHRIFLFVLTLSLLGGSPSQAQDAWPTTEFTFEIQRNFGQTFATAEKLEALEDHANRVAEYYASVGFLPPSLPLVDNRYKIFFDFESKSDVGMASCESEGTQKIYLPAQAYPSLQSPGRELGYKVQYEIAHEMFHAIQRSYPGMESCDRPLWILEGSAEAISVSLMRDLGVLQYFRDCDFVRDFGAFSLGVEDYATAGEGRSCPQRADYGTSAIWRFLALAKAAGGTPAVTAKETNFAYLHDYFNGLVVTPNNATAIYENLDQFLNRHFGSGLRQMYSNAVSWQAGGQYVGWSGDITAKIVYLDEHFWPGCEVVSLGAGNNVVTKLVDRFAGMRARCFVLQLDPKVSSAHVVVEATGLALDRLTLGLGGGRAVAPMDPVLVDGEIVRSTRVIELTADRDLLGTPVILTYVPKDFDDGLVTSVNLKFLLPNFYNNMAPAPAGGSPLLDQPLAEVTAQEADQLQADSIVAATASTASRNLVMSTLVSRDERSSACHGDDPFVYLACGPKMTIRLGTFPNAAPDLSVTRTSGGTLAQVATSGQALSQSAPGGAGDDWMQAAIELENQPGNSVTLTFPLIGYGETGSFSNALISTANGRGDGVVKTIGPADNILGRGIGFKLGGQVSIDHYSEDYISGTYSGVLADDQIDFIGDDPTLPVVGQIAGSFFAVRPWSGDRKFEYLPYEIYAYQQSNLGNQTGTAGQSTGGQSTPSGTTGGSEASDANAPVDCDCQCGLQVLMKDNTQCNAVCTPVWELICPLE